jgi:hypothetical protein
MGTLYAIPGTVALVEWLVAFVLFAASWYRTKYDLNRVGDSLVLAGLVTGLAGVVWLASDVSVELALTRSSRVTGLSVSALTIYATLAYRRTERLSALAMLSFTIPIQAYAVGRLWWGIEVVPPQVLMPVWMALGTLMGLVGYGGLAVAAAMIALSFVLYRVREKLPADRLAAAAGLPALEWRSLQIAVVTLTASLSIGLFRLWWGLGQVMAGGLIWALVTWFLLMAGVYGLLGGGVPRRPARALLVLACGVGVLAVLTLTGQVP